MAFAARASFAFKTRAWKHHFTWQTTDSFNRLSLLASNPILKTWRKHRSERVLCPAEANYRSRRSKRTPNSKAVAFSARQAPVSRSQSTKSTRDISATYSSLGQKSLWAHPKVRFIRQLRNGQSHIRAKTKVISLRRIFLRRLRLSRERHHQIFIYFPRAIEQK